MKSFKYQVLFLVLFPVCLFGALVAPELERKESLDKVEREAGLLAAKIDEYMSAFVEIGMFNGSVLVAKDGNILTSKGCGVANYEKNILNTPQTKFCIGSCTKQFTAAAIMILQERGLLNVSDTVSKYIPDYFHGDEITIHHLLSHTSGIPNYTTMPGISKTKLPPSLEKIVDFFKQKPLKFTPGEKFEYSNSNYILLSLIIEKVSQQSFALFMKENIFQPLNMVSTGFTYDSTDEKFAVGYFVEDGNLNRVYRIDMSFAYGDGNLMSTVEDLYLWDRALYTEKLFSKELRNKMFTLFTEDYGYGLCIDELFGHRHIWHDGALNGFQTMFSRFIDDNICIIVLSNAVNLFDPSIEKMRDGLAAIIFGEEYELPKRRFSTRVAIGVDPEIYNQYVGTYKLEEGHIYSVTKENTNLFVQASGGPKIQIYPESETIFFLKVVDAQVSFVRDERGKVTKLILHQDGENEVAEKVLPVRPAAGKWQRFKDFVKRVLGRG
jgi:CubicO group peptidase (beta-lactamase class C family)